MPNVKVYDMMGNVTGEIALSDKLFAAEVNEAVLHAAVRTYLANQRQGTQSTLTRAEVSGGGRKPWRQKGTGRARQGSTRAPQWTHGGVAFAPKPRSYRFTVNKKVRRLAMKSALSSKVAAEEMIVLDSIKLDAIKTKEMAKMFSAIEAGKKVLVVLPENNEVIYKSIRNIEGAKVSTVNTLNVYDILNCDKIVVLKDAVTKIEEVYA
jgi:large subunit ribosomal protein L4